MQQDFESRAIDIYAPFIHKQARSYFRRYSSCCRYGGIDYEEFYQEAAVGFLQAIRTINASELPLPPVVLTYARQYIRHLIFQNLVLSYDGIHRRAPSATVGIGHTDNLSSITTEASEIQSNAATDNNIDDVDLFTTIDALPPAQATTAICLINGLSRREIARRKILPRRTINHAVECLRVIFN